MRFASRARTVAAAVVALSGALSTSFTPSGHEHSPRELGVGGGPRDLGVEEAPTDEAATDAAVAEPLSAERPVIDLPVDGHASAIVSLPLGARAPRPVLVAAHGRDDVAEPLCATWRDVVGDRGFVLCPRGLRSDDVPGTWTWATHDALDAEIDHAVAALRARFPEHVADGPLVYAGFSLGSFYGAKIVSESPARTPRVVLIEGGHDPWTDEAIASFVDGGGERVLFVTGQDETLQRSREVARALDAAGVRTRIEHVDGAGHAYRGDVAQRLALAFDWVVEGDSRW